MAFFIIILFFLSTFGTTLGPIIWIYNNEILSEKGVAISCAANWLSAAAIGIIVPIFSEFLYIPFFAFAIFNAFGIYICISWVKETRGLD